MMRAGYHEMDLGCFACSSPFTFQVSNTSPHASLLLDHRAELREQSRRVVRPRRSLRMILHTEDRLGLMAHALDRLIVEVETVHYHVRRQRLRVHRKPVVLRGDLPPAGFKLFPRLVGPPVPELQLEGLPAKCLAENLVAETYSKNRNAGLHQITHRLH